MDTSPAANPVELAQAQAQAPGQAGVGEAIGQVSAVEGAVTITHPDGSKVQATTGAPIFQGDLIETAKAGAVGITFADDSTFSLADNGSMVIDQMVYDPASQTGKSAVTIAEGVFTFVSGQIAKTDVDAMVIKTPVAVIGIRGTAGGGKAGPEGTPNTFSMFVDPRGGTFGEMTIKSLGGVGAPVVLSKPLQTTQLTSQFIPPIKVITLPPQVAQQFYAKAAGAAPTKPVIAPTNAGPTGDQGGPTGPAGDQQQGGPAADKAAADAFQQALAGGASLDAAIGAAVNVVAGDDLKNTLAGNPLAFGSEQSGDSIINAIVDKVVLGVTGNFDPLTAGTGKGAGFGEVTGNFFTNGIGDAIKNDITAVVGGVLSDLGIGGIDFQFGGGFNAFGPGTGLFGPGGFGPGGFGPGPGFGFDDPFAFGFNDPFGFDFFGFGDVFFAGIGEDFFLESGDLFLFGDEDVTFIGPVTTIDFGEVLFGSAGNDTLVGTALNTNFFMGQNFSGLLGVEVSFLGGTDTVDGGGGINQLTFDDLDDLVFTLSVPSTANAGSISYTGSLTGSINFTDVQQFLFADVPNSLSSGFNSGTSTTAADAGDTIVFPSLLAGETGMAWVGDGTANIINVTGAIDGALVFGKGGGDTINVNVATDGLLIGGITTTDNLDLVGIDGIPDNAINKFDYTFFTSAVLSGLGATGLQVNLVGTDFVDLVNRANFGADGLVRDFNANDPNHVATINNNLLDVGHFVASGGDDQISVLGGPAGAGMAVLDGGPGNDSISLSNGARIGTIDGGEDGDSYDLGAGLTFSGTVNVVIDRGMTGTDTAIVRIVDGTANITPTITAVEQITVSVEALGSPTYNGTNAPAAQSYGATFTAAATGATLTMTDIDAPNFSVSGAGTGNVNVTFINAGGVNATGGAGNDSFTGFTGADTLAGGSGADTLTGGTGADNFDFVERTSTDTVTDFARAEEDRIRLDVDQVFLANVRTTTGGTTGAFQLKVLGQVGSTTIVGTTLTVVRNLSGTNFTQTTGGLFGLGQFANKALFLAYLLDTALGTGGGTASQTFAAFALMTTGASAGKLIAVNAKFNNTTDVTAVSDTRTIAVLNGINAVTSNPDQTGANAANLIAAQDIVLI